MVLVVVVSVVVVVATGVVVSGAPYAIVAANFHVLSTKLPSLFFFEWQHTP